METKSIILNKERNVTLTAYLQEVNGEFHNISRRPAILVMPGGGYSMCSDREADPVAFPYLQAGYQVFVLRYSVGEYAEWPQPLEDYEQAMELIRSSSEVWNLYPDKIAVIGFSAGGHLAAAAATCARNRPDAAILGYAVTEGETARECLASAPDLVSRVDAKTCPCFVFATRTDNVVPVSNSICFIKALAENGVMFESHIYAYGPHGFTVCNSSVLAPGTVICSRVPQWVADSIAWLKDMLGDFGTGEMSAPKCGRKMNGDREDFLSIDCTMGHLMTNKQAREVFEAFTAGTRAHMVEEFGDQASMMQADNISPMILRMTVREAFSFGNVPIGVLEELNSRLKQIPNEVSQ